MVLPRKRQARNPIDEIVKHRANPTFTKIHQSEQKQYEPTTQVFTAESLSGDVNDPKRYCIR